MKTSIAALRHLLPAKPAIGFRLVLALALGALALGCGSAAIWAQDASGAAIGQTIQAASPTFTPAAGTYYGTQQVSFATATQGASIYYTLDGSTPSISSAKYKTALAVSKNTTIQAIAVASGDANSTVAKAVYTILPPKAATPVIKPAAGTYTAIQSVTITDATSGAAIDRKSTV